MNDYRDSCLLFVLSAIIQTVEYRWLLRNETKLKKRCVINAIAGYVQN